MNPIRPPVAPSLQPAAAARPADAARAAAQRAFFEIAMGKAPGAAAVAAAPTAAQAPAAVQAAAPTPAKADAPQRPLRPGSLLDIRV